MPLDCVQNHRVYIYDRGGVTRIGELKNLNRVKWGRVRDDISEAEVDISGAYCAGNAVTLDMLEPGRHEFVVFRGDERAWEGPITRALYTRTGISFFAKDVLHYAYRTAMQGAYSSAYPNVEFATSRAKRILIAELGRAWETLTPPINVLPYLVEHHTSTDAQTSRVTVPMQSTVFEHIDDIAAKGGMDYTTVGRAIHLWDTDKPLGYAPRVTDGDFLGDIYVTAYGMELGTRAIATDGQGHWGEAGGIDPYYGAWERLATAYDEETDDGPPPTEAVLRSQAQRNLSGRNPTPIQVRIPDGSSLNPKGVLGVEHLVPGTYIPMTSSLTARKISQMQKLNKVDFTESAEGEQITVTMFPASAADDAEVGP